MYFSLLTAWANAPADGVDFRGVDIQYSIVDNANACQQACNEDDKCQFYTYVTENFFEVGLRYSIVCAQSLLKQTNL